MKPSLRAYVVRHAEGHITSTLMRHQDRPFGLPAPTGIAETIEEACRYVEDVLRARMLENTDHLEDYLFEDVIPFHDLELEVHPLRTVDKTPVIGDRAITLTFGYALFAMPRGGYRVMMPRFGWWFVCETPRSAPALIRQLIGAQLLGESSHGLLQYRRGVSESVLERTPSWANREPKDVTDEELDIQSFRELFKVAEEWVTRAKRRQLPATVGALTPEQAALVVARPARSIVLVGPSGTGKTAWVRMLARHFSQAAESQGKSKQRRRLWATSTERIVSGMQFLGEWQERVLSLVLELQGEEDFFYVDHLSAFLREQPGGGSVGDFFIAGVREGTLHLIAECNDAEWERAQRSHPQLCAHLHVVRTAEPAPDAMPSLLRAFQERRAPQVVIHTQALRRLVSHLAILVRSSAFPGKAFRFLEALVPDPENAPARTLHPADVSAEVARYTGLPLALVSDDVVRTRDDFAAELRARVIGQDAACDAVSGILTRFKAGLKDPERPLGVLLFVGPTGVGKTELAKQLARTMLGSDKRLIRLDMSEYQHPGSSARMVQAGASHGASSGHGLASKVRESPFAVVLFDEIEKAHPEVFDLLLGILGEGRLTDSEGRDVDFRSAVIVMTSNLGAGEGTRLGFDADQTPAYVRRVREQFRPELTARIDHIVPFSELTPGDVRRIVDLAIDEVRQRTGLTLRHITLHVDDDARDWLATRGYQPGKGARALHRVIEEEVVSRIGARLAANPRESDTALCLGFADGALVLSAR